ncbi:EAL domain-containing protein [Delftia acidovorans]|uniref:bifunctional diguanylate cyclase/phosphodiesterase n=1 Tax=Delftia acidovorans TaxID=80866 RepID=UPI001EFD179D|nr:EAL domain-containing protein [Delftia acidovorans]MCG8986153.1 EAL domain-containing protein [Delftia acidovorans]
MAAVAGRSGPWLPGARYGNLCMPAFRLSLRTAVTAPFIAVFVVTAGLLAAWQQRQVDQLINRESLRLLDSLSTTTRHQLADYLETPLRVQQALAETVARQALYTPGDLRPIYGYLTRSFTELYAQHHQISLLSFGGVQGEYTGVRLEPDGRYRLILQDHSTQGALQIFEGLEPGPPMSSLAGYDPRVRPWYQPAIHKDGPHWSPIYTVTGDRGDTTISASTSVRVSGQLAGVVAADVRLSSMNRFLRDEPLRGNGHIAVVDAQGYMVAHSSELSVLKRREGPYDPPVRLRLSESPDLALRSLAALLPPHLSADPSAPAAPQNTINLSFKEQGQIYHGQVTAFHDARGIDWRILVLQPESDLVSSMRADSRHALVLAFGLALLGLGLGVWCLRRALRPLAVTADAANRLAKGDWSAVGALPDTSLVETSSLVSAFHNMAQRLQESFEHMRALLQYDSLTQLLTRAGLIEQADAAAAANTPCPAALCLLELQNFRSVRDDVGHGTGEQLLRAVAERLRNHHLQFPALLARTASNEFAMLWLHDCTPQQMQDKCRHLLEIFDQPFSVGKDDIVLRGCAGAVSGELLPGALPEWLRNASIALGEAQRGSHPFLLFEPSLAQKMLGRTQLAMELRQALERNELRVFYQPVVDLATGSMVGAEALVRWNSPTRGMVPPGVFIPVAEESDLILSVGEWVLRTAAHDIASHLPQLPTDFELHVNMSARELIQSDFASTLEQALATSGLPARLLTLELTESMLLDDSDATLQRIAAIRALGVKIAIDDFGTGYSSLAYLSRLRFDCIKIDQSFVGQLPESESDKSIVTAVLRIAQGFGVKVVAEGVEEQAQARLLHALGCEHAQGYLFERPVPLAQMLEYRSPWHE